MFLLDMSTSTVNIHDAKTHFSKLLRQVASGSEIIISKAGEPIAKLVPVDHPHTDRKPGSAKGKVQLKKSFFEPMPDWFMDYFS